VRDFIAAEYTLSENYVHGLAAFGPRLKNFESPHSSRGSSPGRNAGNSVKFLSSEVKDSPMTEGKSAAWTVGSGVMYHFD
jgi:hypothetical protein